MIECVLGFVWVMWQGNLLQGDRLKHSIAKSEALARLQAAFLAQQN